MSREQEIALNQQHVNSVSKDLGQHTGTENLIPNDPTTNPQQVHLFQHGGQISRVQDNYSGPGADRWMVGVQRKGVDGDFQPYSVRGADDYRRMESELSAGAGINPWTNQPWGLDENGKGTPVLPHNMDVGQLTNNNNALQRFKTANDVNYSDLENAVPVKQLADHAVELFKSINPRDMGYLSQGYQKLRDASDADLRTKSATLPESKRNFEDLASTLEQLSEQGVKLSGLPGQAGNTDLAKAASSGLQHLDLLIEPGSKAALPAIGANAAVQAASGMLDKMGENTWNTARLGSDLLKFDNQFTQQIIRRAADLTGPGTNNKVPETLRSTIRGYIPGMLDQGIGIDDNAWSKSPNLFDVQNKDYQQSLKDAKTATDAQQGHEEAGKYEGLNPWQKTAAQASDWLNSIPALKTLDTLNQNVGNAVTGAVSNIPGVKQFVHDWSPQSTQVASPTPSPTPTPLPSPTLGQLPNPSRTPTEIPVASPAPIGTPNQSADEWMNAHGGGARLPNGPIVPEATPQTSPSKRSINDMDPNKPKSGASSGDLPHLTQQEHVDALEPGTPFMWGDPREHPDPYVKV
jgi:hypothetical protein